MSWTRYVVLLLVVLGAASVVGQGPPGGPGGANRTPAHDWSADMAMKIRCGFVGSIRIVCRHKPPAPGCHLGPEP